METNLLNPSYSTIDNAMEAKAFLPVSKKKKEKKTTIYKLDIVSDFSEPCRGSAAADGTL
jgi:hypothetical protein